MNTSENPQYQLELQRDEMEMESVMVMHRLMMKPIMPCLPMICVEAMIMPSTIPPPDPFQRRGFLRVVVALNFGSQIRLRALKVFDEAE
jgi:hypothetical protein